MAQKNETLIFGLALLITGGALVGGGWLFREPLQQMLGTLGPSQSTPPVSNPTANPTQSPSPSPGSQPQSTPGIATPMPLSPATTFAAIADVPNGLFNYGGSTTWAPIRRDVDAVIKAAWPNYRLRYTEPITGAPGSGSGIKMLLSDQLAFSQSSRPLKDAEYQRAEQRGFRLLQIPVAIDGLAIAVHPDLAISGITLAQLKGIYTGQITNWQQLGGPDLAIAAYSRRPEEGGTVEFFVDSVLQGEAFGSTVTFIPTTTEALRATAQNPGGLYYASAPEVVPQCTVKTLPIGRNSNAFVPAYQAPPVPPQDCPDRRNTLNANAFQNGDYPITRRLFVIVKENGQIDQQAGIAYAQLLLTEEGQALISQAGFVPIQ